MTSFARLAFISLGLVTLCIGFYQVYTPNELKEELIFNNTPPATGQSVEALSPLTMPQNLNADRVSLGKKLFHDTRLSVDNALSCGSCHQLGRGGVDGLMKPVGHKGKIGKVNTPTVFNSGFNFKQFWDGRANTLEEQIDGPVLNPDEMASNWELILNRISADKEYSSLFQNLYPDGVTVTNIKNALATFERSLVTVNSRFDQYLHGNDTALNEEEKKGYALFRDLGCISCHQGANVGGNMFETFGVMEDYFHDRGNITEADYGRYNVTKNEEDRFKFKVPSLRNIALTAPYFHDGSAQTLEEAIRVMAKYQLGAAPPKDDIEKIAAFLRTLSGEYKE